MQVSFLEVESSYQEITQNLAYLVLDPSLLLAHIYLFCCSPAELLLILNKIIVQDAPEDAVVTLCGHVFCNQCILDQLTGDDSMCPVSNCRVRLNATPLFSRGTLECSLRRLTCDFKTNNSSGEMVHFEKRSGIDSSYASSKVRAALDIILSLPKIDSKKSIEPTSEKLDGKSPSEHMETKTTEKAIVFSQWTRMLDLLEVHLKTSHVTYRRLDGTMSVAARDKAVNDFNTVPEVCNQCHLAYPLMCNFFNI
jgi:SNF2 family DNA or RNA helicase